MEIAFGVVGCLAFIFAIVSYCMQKKEHVVCASLTREAPRAEVSKQKLWCQIP
mgnify:CR=1 FL=1